MTRRSLPSLALAGSMLLGSCAGGTSVSENPTVPAPLPGEPAPPPPPPGGRGTAVTFRAIQGAPYLVERHDSLTLQYEGGASQDQFRDRTAFVRLTLAGAGVPGSYRVTIVLDSLLAWENGVPVPPDSAAAARGTQWNATLTPTGELQDLRANRQSTLGDELATTLRLLLPRIPQGGVRQGMEWGDTVRYELVADAFPGIETAVMEYRAKESEGSTGRKAIALESEGSYTRSGTRLQGEQGLEMTASGKRKATHLIALEGQLLSASGSDEGEMTISVPAVGQTVPVRQSSSYSITAGGAGAR